MKTLHLSVWLLACCAVTAVADEVTLINGDVLSGKVTSLTDHSLTFQADLAGTVTVQLTDIDTLSTDEPVTLELKDGSILQRRLVPAGPGKFRVEAGETVAEQELAVADITAINRPPEPAPHWTGGANVGWTVTRGNTRAENRSASFSATKRMEQDRLSVGFDYGRGEQKNPTTGQDVKTEDWWRAVGKYDYFFVPRAYGFLNGRYEKDAIANLDRRVIIGGGAGLQLLDTARTSFGLEAGLASNYEKYDTATTGKSKTSVQLGYNLTHAFNDSVSLVHDLVYLPSTDRFSDYYLTSTAEVVAHFSKRFFGSFKTIFGYDASPALGLSSTDIKYILGIGISF